MSTGSKEAARAYRERAIEGAGPARLVRLMLEGALRAIDRAAGADARDPRSCFLAELTRADDIVSELALAIDPQHAPELARQTAALYDFANARLRTAIARREAAPAAEARQVLARLHDAWRRLDEGQA
ncbi:MAG: flagellar export chaperone FliS [Planctomycetes bacterium]|nr:flagellar export chaperone FliS [Planctomycetota bacterium]